MILYTNVILYTIHQRSNTPVWSTVPKLIAIFQGVNTKWFYKLYMYICILQQTPNTALWTMCNISFVFQTIHTKLGICVYNHICNKMASVNKLNFQK